MRPMGNLDDVLALDATGQAELIRQGEVSAGEVVGAAIEAAKRVNPRINAIIHPRYEAALAEATAVDPGGPHAGPFAGVPMVVKDLMCVTPNSGPRSRLP